MKTTGKSNLHLLLYMAGLLCFLFAARKCTGR